MIKRLISATLCLVLLASAFSVNAFADATTNRVDTKVADAKIYVENDKVEKGDIVVVTIYVENVTAKEGLLACDLPFSYDKSKLSFVKLECIFPSSWDLYGEFIGHETPDEDPWYLRSVCEAGDMIENYTKYSVKKSKELGYKLTFKAVAEGDAFVAVEDVGNSKIMFVSYEDGLVINYGGNGMKVTVKVGGEEDSSSAAPVEPDDSSVAESEEPDDSSAEDSSEAVSDEPVSGDVESSELASSVDVSLDTESTEVESIEVSEDANSSADVVVSSEASEDSSEENSADGKTDDDKGGLPGFVVPVIIVVAVAALLGVGGFLFMKKKTDNAQE